MKKTLRSTSALRAFFYGIALLLMTTQVSWGQSYLGLDGGFEGAATIDNSAVATVAATGKWTKNNASTTIADETSLVRSGGHSLKITNSTTSGRRVWSPLFTQSSTTSNTTIQFYRRSANNTTNFQQSMLGVGNGTTTDASSGSYAGVTTVDTWEKVTYTRASWTYTDIAGVIFTRLSGTGTLYVYADDVAVYAGAVDILAPSAPSSMTVSQNSLSPTTKLDLAWGAASGGVDGGGYMVVRYATAPVAADDPNVNGIYKATNNYTVTTAGTVVYQGTATSFTDDNTTAGLNAATTYYYKVYTYDKAYNYSTEFANTGTSGTTGSSGSSAPTLTAATTPTVDANFDITFTDDATWRGAITAVKYGATTLTLNTDYTIASGIITLIPSGTVAGVLRAAGSATVTVVATGYSDATVIQAIGAGAATKLGIKTQPTAPASNGAALAIQPAVYIQDQYGNTTSSTASVTAAVSAGSWALGGTTSVAASAGTTTFSGLTATSAAAVTGATIAFTSGSLTGVTSGTFNIAAPVITLTQASGATVDGPFVVSFTDNSTWRAAITSITVGGTALDVSAYSISAGQITFTPSASSFLQSSGSKSIVIIATAYSNATVTQTIGAGVPTVKSTAAINAALASGATRTITCTAIDQYDNLVLGYTFAYDVTITNNSATAESYTIDSSPFLVTSTSGNPVVATTNSSGIATFTAALPATIDGSDGISIQVQLNNDTTNIGDPFSFTQLASQTITFDALTPVTYGDAVFTVSATGGASGNPVTFTSSNSLVATCTGTNGTIVTIIGSGSCMIYANQAGDVSYNAALQVGQPLTVSPKVLTLPDAVAESRVYNALFTTNITGTLTGVINGDDVTLVGTLKGTFVDANVANGIAVTSNCTLTGAKAGNYTLTQPTGLTANITQATQTIILAATATKYVGDADYTLAATSPTSSTNVLSYSSSNTNVASIDASTGLVHIGVAGTAIITVSQVGNINYSAASNATQTITVNSIRLIEDFNFTGAVTLNGWTAHSSGGTNAITAATGGTMSYSGYLSSGVGNEITMATSGEDDNKAFSAQTTGSVYASFLVNITTATLAGDYFVNLGATSGATVSVFGSRIWVKKDANGNLAFGISKSSTSANIAYTGFNYVAGTTYLIVAKYNFVSGATNDNGDLFVNPAMNSVEPTPVISTSTADNVTADPTGLSSFCLRQGTSSSAPTLKLDGIRVSTNWTDIVGLITPTLSVSNSPQTYTGSAIAATVTGSVAGTVANVKYDGSATVPSIAGTYAITADFAPTDSANYNSLTATSAGNFVISKASSSVTVTGTAPFTYTYVGTAKTPAFTASGSTATITYAYTSVPSGSYNSTTAPTNPGSYSVTATVVADDNYDGATSSATAFTIDAGLYTYIPDANFLQALIDPATYNITNLGDCVLTSDISGITILDVSSNYIADLTGIAAFTSLDELTCEDNLLTSIDVSALPNLRNLAMLGNQLVSASDLKAHLNLTYLDCDDNLFTSIDVSGLPNLKQFYCNNNQLTSLNVKGLSLTNFECKGNPSLTCILVDNVADANTAATTVDPYALVLGDYFWAKYPGASYLTFACGTITWNGSAWNNAVGATALDEAIIAGNFSTSLNTGLVSAKKLTVNSGILTVKTGTNLTVENEVVNTGSGSIVVENNANLIQVNNTTNSGPITVNRDSNALFRSDYAMWSSPVAGQNLLAFSPLTSIAPKVRFYTYDSGFNLYSAVTDPSIVPFAKGAGYLIRMPNEDPSNLGGGSAYSLGTAPITYHGVFTGVPNNGDVTLTVSSGTYNAVGNPYPSVLDAELFKASNTDINTLYFWRKTNNPNQGTLPTTSYATFNISGNTGVGVAPDGAAASYPTIVPDKYIQVGQGFLFTTGLTSVVFNNGMRAVNNGNKILKTKIVERNRIWLNLSNPSWPINQMALCYMDGATQGIDEADSKYFNDSQTALNSVINNEEFVIQGRSLPFDGTDVVPLAFKTTTAGDFTIAIDHVDGLFSGTQDIFLRDNTTGIETDLKAGAYTFTAAVGVDNARFSLKYQKSLNVIAPTFNENSVTVYKNKGTLYVNSGNVTMANIKVFDIQGRLIAEQKNVKANTAAIKDLKTAQQVLIVKITAQDNSVVSKKVVN